jgi:hypothetical protein
VKRVDKGFYQRWEINTVHFDPDRITVMEMEEALRKAGTYLKTIQTE